MNYRILKTNDPSFMEQEVDSYEKTGWKREGELKIFYTGEYFQFFQVMVKERW